MERNKLLALLTAFTVLSSSATPIVKAADYSISGNGQGSGSTINIQTNTENDINQSNDSQISSQVSTQVDTGNNTVSDSNGETNITTGNANVSAQVENSGNVNSAETQCCVDQNNSAEVTNNQAGSTNSVSVNNSTTTNVTTTNNATITTNITGNVMTGGNIVTGNDGQVNIKTGDANVRGKIVTGPVNVSSVKASAQPYEYRVDVSNNGRGSENYVTLRDWQKHDVDIDNDADVRNYVSFNIETGRNKVKDARGGVNIDTGDAFFDFFIKNGPINVAFVDIECCKLAEKPEKPDKPEKPGEDKPEKPEKPGEEKPGEEEEENGEITPEAEADHAGIGGPQILGISDASSEEARSLFWLVGLFMIGYGAKQVGEYLYVTNSKKTPSS